MDHHWVHYNVSTFCGLMNSLLSPFLPKCTHMMQTCHIILIDNIYLCMSSSVLNVLTAMQEKLPKTIYKSFLLSHCPNFLFLFLCFDIIAATTICHRQATTGMLSWHQCGMCNLICIFLGVVIKWIFFGVWVTVKFANKLALWLF